MDKKDLIQKYLNKRDMSVEDFFGKGNVIDVDSFFIVRADELFNYLVKNFIKDYRDMWFDFNFVCQITKLTSEDIEKFVLVEKILGSGLVDDYFIAGKAINQLMKGIMSEKILAENYAKLCFENKDFTDFLGSDFSIIDDFYVFNIEDY